jgi:hypothetical protein
MIFLSSLVFVHPAFATVDVSHTGCYDKSLRLAKISKKKLRWLIHFKSSAKEIYRSSSGVWGKWVELVKEDGRVRRLNVWQSPVGQGYEFNRGCRLIEKKDHEIFSGDVTPKSLVTDQQLKKLLVAGDSLVYVWSPGFVYSMSQVQIAKDVAAATGLRFVLLAASSTGESLLTNPDVTKHFAGAGPLKIHHSVELLARGSDLHLPTMSVSRRGQLVEESIVGVWTHAPLLAKVLRLKGDR